MPRLLMAFGLCAIFLLPPVAIAQDVEVPSDQMASPDSEQLMQTEAAETASPEVPETIPVLPIDGEAALPLDSPSNQSAQRLDDVMVTATKREKSARDIPVSISAIRGEDLEKQGARDLKDYMMQVPGLSLEENSAGEAGGRRLSIRGVGPATVDGNQTVGQFIGDFPLTDPVGNRFTPDLDPFDLQTVEILKGPQGTAFGATALNGAIRYVPNPPELELWNIRGFADAADMMFGGLSKNYGMAVNVPIGDAIALRGVGVLQDRAGLTDNVLRETPDADSRRKTSFRIMALWQPGEDFIANAVFLQQEAEVNDVLVPNSPGQFENHSHPGPSSIFTEFQLADIDLRYETDHWGSLVWQSSLQKKLADVDVDAGLISNQPVELLRGYQKNNIEGTTHELRWVSDDSGRWNWILGAFYQHYELNNQSELYVRNAAQFLELFSSLNSFLTPNAFTPRGINAVGSRIEPLIAVEKSIYGELARKLGERWEATLGVRGYRTSVETTSRYDGVAAQAYEALAITQVGNVPRPYVEQSERGLSPKLSLVYKRDQDLMVYATVSRGFQFGGANSAPLLPVANPVFGTWPVEYQSSNLWNREIGVRTDWLGRTFRLDATIYDIDWSDAQLSQSTANTVFTSTYTDNVGKVRSRGAEVTLNYLTPLPGLSLNLATAYGRAETASAFANNGNEIPAGTPLPLAPKLQTASTIAYNTFLGPWITSASATLTYWDKTYSNLFKEYEVYGFGLWGANLSVSRPDWAGAPALTLGIANLTDVRGLIGRSAFSADASRATPNQGRDNQQSLLPESYIYYTPRTISLRFTADF